MSFFLDISDKLSQYQSSRELIQPQWIFDSINSCICLPVSPYKAGIPPPPHLSPFVDDIKEGYVPQQRVVLQELVEELRCKETVGAGEENSVDENNDDDDDVDLIEAEEALHQHQIHEEVRILTSVFFSVLIQHITKPGGIDVV